MDMIMIGLAIVGGAIAGAGLMYVVMKRRIAKERRDAINGALDSYVSLMSKTVDALDILCPKCAFNCKGKACSKIDVENIVRYGKCTRYEEKRF